MNEAHLMEQWAREVGAQALDLFNKRQISSRRKSDRSVVTDVDEAAERILRERIQQAFPDDQIIGEEGGGQATSQGRVWVIDPIDGTGSFVAYLPTWCISIGLVIDGRPAAGCVYLPVPDHCFLAGLAGPASLNGEPIRAQRAAEGLNDFEAWMSVPSNVHRRYHIRFPGKVRSLGSTAASICYVASGNALAGLVGRSNGWDIAGAQAILERAGGCLMGLDGSEIDWPWLLQGQQSHQPLFAAECASFEDLRERVKQR